VSRWLLFVLSALPGACTVGVAADGASGPSATACSEDRQCTSGMRCQDGFCRGRASIDGILLAVALPESENLAHYSNTSFVLPLDIPASGIADVMLPELASVTVEADFEHLGEAYSGCVYARDIAANTIRASISRRWPVEGLERSLAQTAKAVPATFSGLPVASDYEVHLELSSAFQDYVGAQSTACMLPPVLFRDVAVRNTSGVSLSWPAPRAVNVDLRVPTAVAAGTGDLSGWLLDIVDPIGERELAIPVTLQTATPDATDPKVSHYRATIAYNPIASAGSSPPGGTEQLRLRPRAAHVAPIYYATLASLSLFGSGGELVVQLNGVPEPVVLTGRVESESALEPIARAIVSFTSTNFSVGNEGLSAKFHLSVESDAAGQFTVSLPPGQYEVVTEPPNDQVHASLETTWSVQSAPAVQAGRLLSLPRLVSVLGSADGSVRWNSVASGSVLAVPSSRLLVDAATGTVAMRQSSAGARASQSLFQPSSDSTFELHTDPGMFDVSLRPPEGLPWAVMPGIRVGPGGETLAPLTLPLPVYWNGRLRVPMGDNSGSPNLGDVPRAVMRVFVLLGGTENGRQPVQSTAEASALVQIAETRAGADGSFSLVMPDQLQWP